MSEFPAGSVSEVSVLVPTIGRPESLRALLESLARCSPRAAEIVVVDQSGGDEVRAVLDEFASLGTRHVRSEMRSVGSARNAGLRAASHETVLITDDDCTVDPSWAGEAVRLTEKHPGYVVTGRVLPGGDSETNPSTKEDEVSEDYTGQRACRVLYSGNMVGSRSALLEIGGFDERLPTASDNDLCYRWLRAGRALRYEPSLRVWHHGHDSPDQLERRYVEYWRGQGSFYGKHLRAGDPFVFRFMLTDLRFAARAFGAGLLRRRPREDDMRGILRGMPAGMLHAMLTFRRGEGLAERPADSGGH